jgi:cysteine desulfuration protein SufE
MNINAIQARIIDDFAKLGNWFEKYEYLIKTGESLGCPDENLRSQPNQINGCQSKVWLSAEQRDGKVYFAADSDALITRGILALLLRVLSGQSHQDIASCELYFIKQTGLSSNLSPSRANGLASILKRMKDESVKLAPV